MIRKLCRSDAAELVFSEKQKYSLPVGKLYFGKDSNAVMVQIAVGCCMVEVERLY